jgi:outer membrane lipoprotein-sorting protein
MNSQNLLCRLIYLSVFILTLSGCAQLRPDTNPLLDKKAFFLAGKARSFNQHIITSKGTGWIRLETKTKKDKFKIAWAAVSPNKIRITFLLSGHPVETIIATGEKIIFLSHTGDHSKYSYHSKDPNMEDYIHVPVKLSEMISILLGRLPVKNFDDAYFSPSDASLSFINLRQNWKGLTQSLHLNSKGRIDSLKTTDSSGNILYEMTITKYKDNDFGNIPVKIEIKDNDNRKLTLEIINFLPNPPIKESVFQLTESR